MTNIHESILVIGFNTRPLVYSLYQAGFKVYTVDFFGDIDLFPYVEDSIIITKRLHMDYQNIKDTYRKFLVDFTLELLEKYPDIDYFLIGSGLDDSLNERRIIIDEINKKKYSLLSLNNSLKSIQKSRDIRQIYNIVKNKGYSIPKSIIFNEFNMAHPPLNYPFIMKKKASSGGINIYKINNKEQLEYRFRLINKKKENHNWLIQEYIEGLAISCTVISNGNDSEVISINRQIIGLNFLNSPEEFIYCGNIVPANISENDKDTAKKISRFLSNHLGLKGINGFDFVIKNHIPYLMEINPRIPGSIRASEESLNINLLKLHFDSFFPDKWNLIKKIINSIKITNFSTKLIYFAPKELSIEHLKKINNLKYIHDKSKPLKNIKKHEPICSILYKDKTFSDSYFGALKIVDKIKQIIF